MGSEMCIRDSYYTLNFFSSALAPYIFGLVGDTLGLEAIFFGAGALMALGLPLVFLLRDIELESATS